MRAPRGPPLVATLPSVGASTPRREFSDWMRAFADAFRSSVPESAPPVRPYFTLSVRSRCDLFSEFSGDASISPEQSPVRVFELSYSAGGPLFFFLLLRLTLRWALREAGSSLFIWSR